MHGRMSVSMFSPDFVRACVFLGCISVPIGVIFYRLFFYMVSMLGLYRFYWLHQWGIPYRYCRFYLLLAGAVGKRQGIAIPYPSPTPLLTSFGDPLRRGISAAAVDRDIVSLYPVQIFNLHFDISIGGIVFGLRSLAFQKITVGFGRTFFIGGGMDCTFLRLRDVLL